MKGRIVARQARIDDLLQDLRQRLDPRAKSLIVTIYGDSILPHGGTVWLGSLIRLVAPLGLNERMVRTAVFRLTRDDWLTSQAIGRRSYYGFSPSGRLRFEEAHRRIYAAPGAPWDGVWQLVLISPEGPAANREGLRRELLWRGFGQIAPGLFAHPAVEPEALRAFLREQGEQAGWLMMQAGADLPASREGLRRLVARSWDLARLEHDYRRFLDHFRPIWRALETGGEPAPQTAFLIRTLLIHDYRRVLLRDPLLPDELLPAHWPGSAARILCRNLYRRTQVPAERHIMAVLETADGPLPAVGQAFRERFAAPDAAQAP